ncbi:hypothetical protein D3C75_638440 [compost metagenome]
MEEGGQRLDLVACLHLLDIRHVLGIVELSPNGAHGEGSGRGEDFFDTGRGRAFPIGTDHHVVAWLVAGGTAADVTVVVSVAVDHLHRVVTPLVHCRHRDHHRLRAQVQPDKRVRGVAVRSDDGRVLVGEDARLVLDLVERRLVLRAALVHSIFVHYGVVHDQR